MLLGGFDARLNDHPVTGISYNKMRALLAYLAVEREQDHNREVLAALLWHNNDPTTARGNLRRTLSDLRRVLELPTGITLFSTSKNSIRFIPNIYIDVLDFVSLGPHPNGPLASLSPSESEKLLAGHPREGTNVGSILPTPKNRGAFQYNDEERIIALYRGEFLAGLSLPDNPDFEDWLQIQRETLHRRALALLEQLSNHHMQIGAYGKALQFALRYTELEPWGEDAHCRVMRLYALGGQNSAAIVQYETCCRLLKKELGALPSEETRQLAERIRNGETGRESPNTVEVPPPSIPQPEAERRQVTVLYCELTLTGIDDPDEAMALLHTPQARCVTIIRQLSGHVVQTHGGGLLAYFGYPQAHEDAARRAVQAALAITREAAYGIEIRTGIHTGLIITGGESSMPDTVGQTSRLAIQLRHSAAHNEVAISQQTHDIVAGYYDCASLGVQSLLGIARPVEIFRVEQESGARTRLDAAVQLTPLAGRKIEIARLMGLWEEAVQGMRHVVLLQGEAGIGKSRLLHTLKELLTDQPHAIRELRCFPEFSQSPFYPLIVMLEAIFGFVHGDTPELKFGKLAQYLEAHYPATVQNAVPLLAQLLSLPLDGHYPAQSYSPQKQKEQTIAILLTLLQALAAQQPVLLIVEDLHWIDPSTLELLTLFVEQTGTTPVLAILTARPEFVPLWKRTIEATLTLAPLVENEVVEMIASLRADIPAATIRHVAERTDGVPLFVEEVAKIAAIDNQESISANIPATLQDLLAARIDTMEEAKYTAQLAATLGREFDLNLLRKVSPYAPSALAHSLIALQDAGLILKVNETVCQFKHALIQEAAYQSQTRTGRQAAHQRIAQALLSDFPDVVTAHPELLAQHFASGGEARQSIEYWIKAGQRAARNSAIAEAIGHFNSGLQLMLTLPPDQARDCMESELRINLGTALIAAKGYGSVEAGQMFSRAMELGEQWGDSSVLHKSLWGMWLTSSSRIGHLLSLELAQKLLHLAEQNNEPLQLQQALYAMGNSLLWTGQLEKARIHQERAMALYQPSHHETMVSEFGENVCVSCGSQLAWVLWLLGFPDQARAVSEQTLALARQVNHPYSLCYAKAHGLALARWMRQIETTRQLAEETMMLANQHGFPVWLLSGTAFHGWVLSMQGQATGIAYMQQGAAIVRAAMSGIEAYFLGLLGEAYMHLGQTEESLPVLHQTLHVMHAKADRFLESETLRLKGECLLHISANHTEETEACFSQALAISHRQGAKSLGLRAAMSMARLWQQQGKQEDARRVLREVYDEFTEGFDTPDLQEAANLLQTLV
jgi:DNA-binding SARP family transcriptional activator